MFDTHCHLNFKVFKKNVEQVIKSAQDQGVNSIVVPGTDIKTSKKAIDLAKKYQGLYAAVGIHPHHVFEIYQKKADFQSFVFEIEKLLENKKVVAVGEIGIDRHLYKKTRHQNYQVDEEFIDLQKIIFEKQIKLAKKYQKSVIIHNREAKKDLFEVLEKEKKGLEKKAVFHCCEPDLELLEYAKKNQFFIGVDGDLIYSSEKQEFIKKVPLEMLVLETDAPFLSPFKIFPNQPKNLQVISEFVAQLKNLSQKKVKNQTTINGKILFQL